MIPNYPLNWQKAMALFSSSFENPGAFGTPIYLDGKSAAETLKGFIKVSQELQRSKKHSLTLSLRTLSARCFGGDSKLLDERRAFLEHAFPTARMVIQPRAIMMTAYIPNALETALFIENFDSYRSTVAALLKTQYKEQIAVIYSAGFRSSADGIRQPGNAQFVVINHAEANAYQRFQQWWYNENDNTVDCYFWGDLDYAGMAIIKAMRVKFNHLRAWRAAYECSVYYHQTGARHMPKDAKKTRQRDPKLTGCEYADQELLPLMRASEAFTDQEVVSEQEIIKALSELPELGVK